MCEVYICVHVRILDLMETIQLQASPLLPMTVCENYVEKIHCRVVSTKRHFTRCELRISKNPKKDLRLSRLRRTWKI
jgi:hypothetical protein